MEFFNVAPNSIYGIHNPIGLKYLTRLRVGLSHLREHKFRHNFKDTTSKLCLCQNESENVEHYLLHCPVFSHLRSELFEKLRRLISLPTLISSSYTCNLLLYGNPKYDDCTNRKTVELTISYILATNRFDQPFFSAD